MAGRALFLLAGALGLALVGGAGIARAMVTRYPRVLQYICRDGSLTSAQLDSLARYDALILRGDPRVVAGLRARNPRIELYNNWLPQNIVRWNENDTFWYPDTSYSLIRLCQFYAFKNNWFLRDIHGEPISEFDGYSANWTRYCPKGTYGSSKGLNYVEWLVQVAMPRIMASGSPWQKWGHGSSSFDGLMLEIMVDCLGSFNWQHYQYADPDQDGQAEGVYSECSVGGNADSLSVLYREMNEIFYQRGLKPLLDAGMPVLINGGASYNGPRWQTSLTGVKLECWMNPRHSWWNWRSWFYGLESFNPGEIWGPGYRWAEDVVGHTGVDSLEGWDRSVLQVQPPGDADESTVQRMRRLGFGTALLGDGFYNFTRDECSVFWEPEYTWDFGRPLGDFRRETFTVQGSADTLYVRLFTRGFVEVNPNALSVNGVPAEDSRFGFWQTVSDPAALALGPDRISVTFTYPPGRISPVEACELRFADFPITPQNWEEAAPYAGGPVSSPADTQVSITVEGLAPERTYYFAVKNRVYGRAEPGISANFRATTAPLPADTLAPAPITDLSVAATGQDWGEIRWTAPGDDGADGRAAAYEIRFLAERAILSASDWERARVAPDPPVPGVAGSPETFRVFGLRSGLLYGFAVRALDDAGNRGTLSNQAAAATRSALPPPPRDITPPNLVRDLRAVLIRPRSATLQWTAVADGDSSGSVARYVLAVRRDSAIATPSQWALADTSQPMPSPLETGRLMLVDLEGLLPGTTYGAAVRAYDAAGNRSPLPEPFTFSTGQLPDTLPPRTITDLHLVEAGQDWLEIAWAAPGDSGTAQEPGGAAAGYLMAWRAGPPILSEADWENAIQVTAGLPAPAWPGTLQSFRLEGLDPATSYAVALRGMDASGNRSPISSPFHALTASPPDLSPPDPPDRPLLTWPDGSGRARLSWTPSPDPRLAGYFVLAQGQDPRWSRVNDQPLSDAFYELAQPDPSAFARLAVVAVTRQGIESPRSPSVELFQDEWLIEGPFPHPVEDGCVVRVTIPANGASSADLTLEIRGLTGEMVARLHDGPAAAGRPVVYSWDRRTIRGERAGPGYYYLTARVAGHRTLRTIYLAP